ncbi:hypothetical protein LCGC14_0959340 [marine sediment metagenome]|uniref:Uncharacterized protein n=1 Tax=marine sediment metagenome TaxID=412755 RepID=A0A0F9NET9_9ZZZZ
MMGIGCFLMKNMPKKCRKTNKVSMITLYSWGLGKLAIGGLSGGYGMMLTFCF